MYDPKQIPRVCFEIILACKPDGAIIFSGAKFLLCELKPLATNMEKEIILNHKRKGEALFAKVN